jgi:hypothetical protein
MSRMYETNSEGSPGGLLSSSMARMVESARTGGAGSPDPGSLGRGESEMIDLIKCNHDKRGFIHGARWTGDSGSGKDYIDICLQCGRIFVFGDRDGKPFQLSIHINIREQAEAVSRWVDYVNRSIKE